jgi:hypothetical protein
MGSFLDVTAKVDRRPGASLDVTATVDRHSAVSLDRAFEEKEKRQGPGKAAQNATAIYEEVSVMV